MQRIGFVVFPGFQMMAWRRSRSSSSPTSSSGEPLYEFDILSEHGGPVRSSIGIADRDQGRSATRRSTP